MSRYKLSKIVISDESVKNYRKAILENSLQIYNHTITSANHFRDLSLVNVAISDYNVCIGASNEFKIKEFFEELENYKINFREIK